jgi:hypothetical protein
MTFRTAGFHFNVFAWAPDFDARQVDFVTRIFCLDVFMFSNFWMQWVDTISTTDREDVTRVWTFLMDEKRASCECSDSMNYLWGVFHGQCYKPLWATVCDRMVYMSVPLRASVCTYEYAVMCNGIHIWVYICTISLDIAYISDCVRWYEPVTKTGWACDMLTLLNL